MADASLLKLRGYVVDEKAGVYANLKDKKIMSTMFVESSTDEKVKGIIDSPATDEWTGYYLTPIEQEEINAVAAKLLMKYGSKEVLKEVVVEPTENPKDLVGIKKPPIGLVPPSFMVEVSMAMKNGGEKYGPYNWREHPVKAGIYYEACLRHMMSWYDGEEDATDSKVKHLSHAAACLAILIDAGNTNCLVDDRPKSYTVGNLIKKYTEE